MNPEHVILSAQTAFGTWVTPATAFPVDKFNYAVKRNRDRRRLSGPSRAPYAAWPTNKETTGSMEMPLWGEGLGMLLKAALLNNITSSQPDAGGSPTVYEHAFQPDDTDAAVIADCLSIQAQWNASKGVNILGAALNQLTISCKAGEVAVVTADFIARDEAKVGGTWDYDGSTASPAIIASPTYYSRAILPLIFTGAALTSGGTVTQDGTTKQLSVASGTSQSKIEQMEFTIANNIEAPPYLGGPCPVEASPGDRQMTGKFDLAQAVISTDFYDEYRAGSQIALQMQFLGQVISGSYRRELTITLPLVDFEGADWPEIGGKGRKMRSVSFEALEDATLAMDIGVTIRDTQTSY